MNLQDQRLYKAFRSIISAHEIAQVRREELDQSLEEVSAAKEEAARLIQELPTEQIEELAKLPIETSDVTLTISYHEAGDEPVAIFVQPHGPCRRLFEFMEDKKEDRTDG